MTRNIWIDAGSGTHRAAGVFLNPVSGGVSLRPQPPADSCKPFGFFIEAVRRSRGLGWARTKSPLLTSLAI
jgi:hypothetical protein